MKKYFLFSILLLVTLVASACGGTSTARVQPIKVAVLPVLDVFPLYVAEAQGYFEANGVQVELVPVASAPERDQLMQAGQVDAMLNEVVSTLFYNRDGQKVVIVRFARTATADQPLFYILSAKDSGIATVDDLRNVPIGVSQGTVIEYMTDRVLEKAGLKDEEIVSLAVPKIPDRLALLGSGELKAANLPDPLASLAIQQGAKLIIDDTYYPDVSNSVYAFSVKAVKENPEGVRAFLKAVEQAVVDINTDPTKWNALLEEKKLIPPPLLATYALPKYPTASVPSEAQFADALAWAKDKGLMAADIPYDKSVDSSFLPE